MGSSILFPSNRRVRAGSRVGALAATGWFVAMLAFATPAAATQVFHSPSDDGQPAVGPVSVPDGGVQPVYLYIDGGAATSQVGTACDTGSGSEVCGYTLTVTGLTGLTLVGFTPDENTDVMHVIDELVFRVNGLDTAAPTPGPKRIGELLVNAVTGGSLELSDGEVIGADLSSEMLASSQIVAVPEPGRLLQLATCIATIACLRRGRGRS